MTEIDELRARLEAVKALCVGAGIHGSLISREAVRAALSVAPQPEPDEHKHAATFDAVLRCPNCMQTMRSERPEVDALMRSIEEYRNAPSSTASVPASLPVERCQCLTPDACAAGQRCMVGGGCWDDPRPVSGAAPEES
jgi:hypothetical protein